MSKLSTEERNALSSDRFGLPQKRKFPLNDEAHIEDAAKKFKRANITSDERKSLAKEILEKAKDKGMDTSGWKDVNRVAGVTEQVPPMSDGTSTGNSPPRMMAPYYDEQDELFTQVANMERKRPNLTMDDIRSIVNAIHQKTVSDEKPPTGNQNCQLCTWCAEAQFRGRTDALPRPVYSPRDPVLSIPGETIVLHPLKLPIRNNDDAVTCVKEAGPGARYYVHVNWKGSEGGHEFLLINIEFQVYLMDAQAGIVENVDENQRYFDDTNFANSYMARLDTKTLNERLLKDATDMSKVLPWDPKLDIPYMKEHGMLSDEDYQAAMDMGDLPVQEAACTASLLTVKNQLMNLLDRDFEFIGGSMIPKFTMKSRMKPELAFEVNIVGPNVEVTPVINNIPDILHKRRGIAIMQAAHVVADFANDFVAHYKPKATQESVTQEGAFQDLKNGVNPFSDKLVFHVSQKSHFDGQIWEPRVPEYLDPYDPDDKYFEDNTTPRVCFSTSIEGALNGIMVHMERDTPERFGKMYVYVPEMPYKKYKHKTTKDLVKGKDVWDANVTREVWIMEPVRMKLYGTIQVDQVSKMKRKATVPNAKNEKNDRQYFTFKWHWVVPPKVLEKSTKFEYTTDKVSMWLSNDLKRFKYGLIRNGKLETSASESDYEKYWVFHSGEEVDQAGGGNCWDYVEYEAGYLKAFGVPYKKYFMNFTKTDGKTAVNTHTICVVPYEGKYIYLEGAFKRITSEWGHERRRTFDSLKEIFEYVAECSADYENQDLNYGVWDYTDAKIDYGTPANDFCNWIMSKCRMVFDGEAKKPTVKKEGYRVSRFGNMFQEAEEALSDTEDITIGDLKLDDDTSEEDGPGLPGYIEDRMSDDDLKAFNSDDDDFKLPEEGDFESFKVSDEKLDAARGPIEPQPDEKLSVNDVDLGMFGTDTSDVQNEYDPKDVETLMKLMASEADAMAEYLEAAKVTNTDVLRRLYADIANEERFHMEQLLFAKSEITGEKYEPKDPEVKAEYEELLNMGMDEETAMQTAVDRCHIRGSIAEDDEEERIEIQEAITQMESVLKMFDIAYDHTSMILESGSATPEDVDKAYDIFVEAVYNVAPESEKSALSMGNKRGPIQLLRDALRFLVKALMTILRKFVEFCKRIKNRSREIKRYVKQYGLDAIFDKKVRMYFVNLQNPQAQYIDNDVWFLLGLAIDTTNACAMTLGRNTMQYNNVPRNPKLDIQGNIMRGAELLSTVQLVRSPMAVPKDKAEQEKIAAAFFGYTMDTVYNRDGSTTNVKYYGEDGKSTNTLNTMRTICDMWAKFMQNVLTLTDSLSTMETDKTSIYYRNRKKYDEAVKGLEAVVKACKAMIAALQNDISVIIKLDNDAVGLSIKDTEAKDQRDIQSDPRVQARSQAYETYHRTPDSAGKPSRFGKK